MVSRGQTTGKVRLERAWYIELLKSGNDFSFNPFFCIYQITIPSFLFSQRFPLPYLPSHSLFLRTSILLSVAQAQHHAQQTLSHDTSRAFYDCLASCLTDLQISHQMHDSSVASTRSNRPQPPSIFTQGRQITIQWQIHPPLKLQQAQRYVRCVRSPAR